MTVYQQQPLLRKMVRDLPLEEQPVARLQQLGVTAVSSVELLAAVIQSAEAVETAEDMLIHYGGLWNLVKASIPELCRFRGIGEKQAARLKAALELGRRAYQAPQESKPKVTSPADAANLVMSEMMALEQEHLRVILLNTRNEVLAIKTIYIGSLNTSVVRIGEILRPAIEHAAAALIVLHNHPSGDPSPSPEDVNVTRQIKKACELMDISLLDHVVIGHQRFVSLKERNLGF